VWPLAPACRAAQALGPASQPVVGGIARTRECVSGYLDQVAAHLAHSELPGGRAVHLEFEILPCRVLAG